jgi:hypothetical protein
MGLSQLREFAALLNARRLGTTNLALSNETTSSDRQDKPTVIPVLGDPRVSSLKPWAQIMATSGVASAVTVTPERLSDDWLCTADISTLLGHGVSVIPGQLPGGADTNASSAELNEKFHELRDLLDEYLPYRVSMFFGARTAYNPLVAETALEHGFNTQIYRASKNRNERGLDPHVRFVDSFETRTSIDPPALIDALASEDWLLQRIAVEQATRASMSRIAAWFSIE